ncbi:MAG: antitoxin [Dermatophilaceae bacterium]|jgi:hypothetical protein|nr:antitoxin [Actinomycetales bacterium]MBP8882469.1 antitoxin [Dermatophilaceae bacterium]MBP9919573.1 antitoxin [Dermatophilaceae bacterium]
MSTITETLKAKLDELDLDRRLDEFTRASEVAVKKAVAQAGDLAHDNRDKVTSLLDKAGALLDEKTDGKYQQQFDKVRAQVVTGVDKLAGKRPGAAEEADDHARATDEGMAEPPQDSPWANVPVDEVHVADIHDASVRPGADLRDDKPTRAAWSEHTDHVE